MTGRQRARSTSYTFPPLCASCLLLFAGLVNAEIDQLQFGGVGGRPWSDWTAVNLMVDDIAVPGALQPLQLKPEENAVAQMSRWTRYRQPIDFSWRPGMPRIWRAIGDVSHAGHGANPVDFVDGDVETSYFNLDYLGWGLKGLVYGEYYTLDMGLPIPAERFVLVPPDGRHPVTDEPFTNFLLKSYELTGSNDVVLIESQVAPADQAEYYIPLDIPLASAGDNHESVIEIDFPLQYLRFFRIKMFPDGEGLQPDNFTCCLPAILQYALAELEIYGRGFVPTAVWESSIVDLGQVVSVGRIVLGASQWRVDGDDLKAAPESGSKVTAQLKTGFDEHPTAYYSYNDLGHTVEVAEDDYSRLKPRTSPGHPQAVGWRGPIGQDTRNWSFWSTPVRASGERPRLPQGRYAQLRVELTTDELWQFARLDSLTIEVSSLLARRVIGEVAVADDLHPRDQQPVVPAGEPTEFLYDLAAEFDSWDPGFDAVRIIAPSNARLLGVQLGDELRTLDLELGQETPAPDCGCATWLPEPAGFIIYLPQRMGPVGERRLRLRLETAVFGITGEIAADAVESTGTALPQAVEPGDVSEEMSTNQLRVLTQASSLSSLGAVEVSPTIMTPQGDGVNDAATISYSLFRVLEAAEVEVAVYTLAGDLVWRRKPGMLTGGSHSVEWNGRDSADQLVVPGVYLIRVEVETDEGRESRTGQIAVVY